MRINSTLIIVFIVVSCSRPSHKNFNWKKIESRHSNSEKRKLLRGIHDPITEGFEQMARDSGSDKIFDSFHVVDLDSDGKEDIIYNGYGGAAEEFVMIFMNHKNDLKKDFHSYGHIENLEVNQEGARMSILKILSVGEEGYDSIFTYNISKEKIVKVSSNIKP